MSPARVLEMPAAPSAVALAEAQPAANWPTLTAPTASQRLSSSQVNEWLDCPARWHYHHALGMPEPTNAAAAIGAAIHATAAGLLQLWQQGHEPDAPTIAADLRTQLLYQLAGDEATETSAAAAAAAIGEDLEQLYAQALRMMTVWVAEIGPQLRPVVDQIEWHVAGQLAGVDVHGYIDVMTAHGLIADLKTSSKAPMGISQAHRLQITTYAMLAEKATGRRHTTARLYTLTRPKEARPRVYQQTVEITDADRAYAEWAYGTAAADMAEGLIRPRRSSALCTREYCAHWRACEADFGGAVKE